MKLTLFNYINAALLALSLGVTPSAIAASPEPSDALTQEGDAPQEQPWEFTVLGGVSLSTGASSGDTTLNSGTTQANPRVSAYRLSYWLSDTLSLQLATANYAIGWLHLGSYLGVSQSSGHAMVGIGISKRLEPGEVSPFATLNLGSQYQRLGSNLNLDPFLGIEGGLRKMLNDSFSLRGQIGVKKVIAPGAGLSVTADLSLGAGVRF